MAKISKLKNITKLKKEVSMLPTMGITKEDFVEISVKNVQSPPFEHIGQEWKSNLVGYCRGCQAIWVVYRYEKPTKEGEKYSIKLYNPVILTKKQIEEMAKIPIKIELISEEPPYTQDQVKAMKTVARNMEGEMDRMYLAGLHSETIILFRFINKLYGKLTSKQYFSVQC